MCLMHTDFPVPEGPRIIEILFSGSDMFSPRSTWLDPNALCTSTNSIASGSRDSRIGPLSSSNSTSSPAGAGCCGSWTAISASDGCARVGAPEHLGAEHSDQVDEDQVEHHRLRRRGAHSHGAATGVVPV